ncbi:MAG: hypothetical protein H7144_08900 [Burkholderiales bacterium]|nr:hypothetical protein [Phycisphaerae bacterium]
MNVHDALSQIADIRQQVARAQTFRGYRPMTTAFTGVMAIATAIVQSRIMPNPTPVWTGAGQDPFRVDHYLYLWFVAAVLSLAVVGWEMWVRVRRSGSDLQRDITLAAVEQFVPSLMAGVLVTIVITQFALESIWIIPSLWMILFSMGVYSSRRVLPRYAGVIAGYYLLAGLMVMALHKDAGMHAWTMGAVFGVGQFLAAAWLWFVERRT